jgi:hypothetical protein
MPLQKLTYRAGINREGTDYSNEGGFYDGDKIRFRSGQAEKIGGWIQVSNSQFLGTCRILWTWSDVDGRGAYIGLGTNVKYYIFQGGGYYDITPIFRTASTGTAPPDDLPSNPISTINGSPIVTITDGNYVPNVNDYIIVTSSSTVGGLDINGEYRIDSVDPAYNTYTILASSNATSDDSGGGDVTIEYLYPSGLDFVVLGTGWGAGPWGRGTWGSAYEAGVTNQLRLWSNDNYGTDLVFNPRGGPIFYWKDSDTVSVRGSYLADLADNEGFDGAYVPYATNYILSSSAQRFIMAFGANPYEYTAPDTVFNPMLVRWSDQNNPYQWVPEVTNQAGEFTLSNGSYIVTALATRQENLIWTDSCLYSMQYVGYPYTWSFQVLMDNITIMGPNAAVTVNNVTYWMGRDKFYQYTGVVSTLPCSLRQFVFDDINTDQAYQVFAGSNEGYNEVWWFYVSLNSNGTLIDKYVIYNYLDKVWSYGTMGRTAWLQYGIQPQPIAADYNSRLLYHEIGNDDVSTSSPQPIESYLQSSDFGIEAGEHLGFVWRMLPDVNFNGSSVNSPTVTMTLYGRQNSGSAQQSSDVDSVVSAQNYSTRTQYIIPQFTGQIYTRLRARQMSFEIRSKDLGVAWQLGVPRIDVKPAGKR